MSVSFANLALLAGLVGVAVPIVIHLRDRRRARRVRFAAIEFVLRSHQRLNRFARPRDLVLLALRVAAVAALALAAARPSLVREAAAEADAAPGTTIVVVDDSPSAGALEGGRSVWDREIDRAGDVLGRLAATDAVAVVRLSEASGLDLLGLDRASLPDARRRLRALADEGPDVVAVDGRRALARVVDLARAESRTATEIAVVSRFARATWGEGARAGRSAAADVARPVTVRWEAVGEERELGNLELAAVSVASGATAAAGEGLRVTVRVANHGAAPAEGVAATLRLEGGEELMGFVDVEPGAAAEKTFALPERRGGLVVGEAFVAAGGRANALALDDRRWFATDPGSRLRALIVDGDPQPNVYERETFYLERALNPLRNPDSLIDPRVIGEGGFDAETLDGYDVVVLANLAYPRRAGDLEAFVREGGGLLVTVGENVDPDAYNRALGRLLPRPLHLVRTFGTEGPDGAADRIGAIDPTSVLADLFAGVHRDQLFSVPVYRAMLTDAAGEAPTAAPLVLRSGVPLLVTRTVGAGRTALFATTVDRQWCDLAIRSSFVPLMHETVRDLARRSAAPSLGATALGGAIAIEDAEGAARIRVRAPDGAVEDLASAADAGAGGARAFRFDRTRAAGVYRWERLDAEGRWRAGGLFTANAAPGVGDLRRVPTADLSRSLRDDGAVEVLSRPATAPVRAPLWPGLLAAAVVALALEGLIAGLPPRRFA